jgi:hypothetical protein
MKRRAVEESIPALNREALRVIADDIRMAELRPALTQQSCPRAHSRQSEKLHSTGTAGKKRNGHQLSKEGSSRRQFLFPPVEGHPFAIGQ